MCKSMLRFAWRFACEAPLFHHGAIGINRSLSAAYWVEMKGEVAVEIGAAMVWLCILILCTVVCPSQGVQKKGGLREALNAS